MGGHGQSVGTRCRLEGRNFTFAVFLEAELIFRVFQPFCVLHYHPQLYCKVNDCGLKFVILRACLNILPKNTRPQYVTAVFQLKVYYKLAITGIAWCKAQKKAEAEQEGQLKIYIQGLRWQEFNLNQLKWRNLNQLSTNKLLIIILIMKITKTATTTIIIRFRKLPFHLVCGRYNLWRSSPAFHKITIITTTAIWNLFAVKILGLNTK